MTIDPRTLVSDTAPVPADREDAARWDASRLRKRLMEGTWGIDLSHHMAKHLPPERADAWGPPSVALNTFRSVITQLSQLYNSSPTITNSDASNDDLDLVRSMGLFSRHGRLQQNTLAMRECFIRIHHTPSTHVSPGGIHLRMVTSDMVTCQALPEAPDIPVIIREAVKRDHPTQKGKTVWTWDIWDISDPSSPSYTIMDKNMKTDLSSIYLPLEAVGRYDWIDQDGAPYLPWVLYHAENTGQLWDPYAWSELVWGTMDVGLVWTFWIHAVKDCSWDQKYGIDVDVAGARTEGEGLDARSRVALDPGSMLLLRSRGQGQTSVGTLSRPIDPLNISDSILQYSKVVTESVGLDPSDIQRREAESGVAITIRRDAVRRMQQTYERSFRIADQELLKKVSLVSNTFSGTSLPTDGWSIIYTGLPRSSEEITQTLSQVRELLSLNMITRRDALRMLYPDDTEVQLDDRLEELSKQLQETASDVSVTR